MTLPVPTFSQVYRDLEQRYRCCPVEAGFIGDLADHECQHGRLPGDKGPSCGCWPEEELTLFTLPQKVAA